MLFKDGRAIKAPADVGGGNGLVRPKDAATSCPPYRLLHGTMKGACGKRKDVG
jgi:hypothetical protein